MSVFFDAAMVRQRPENSAKSKNKDSFELDTLNYLGGSKALKLFNRYKKEPEMLDIRNYKPEELMFRNKPNTSIVQVLDLTSKTITSNRRCLIIYKNEQDLVAIEYVTISGKYDTGFGTLFNEDIILKPKKVLYVKPLLQLLKEYAFSNNEFGLTYRNINGLEFFIPYEKCGNPIEFWSPQYVDLFCEEKDE
jgi:hypothetical protein